MRKTLKLILCFLLVFSSLAFNNVVLAEEAEVSTEVTETSTEVTEENTTTSEEDISISETSEPSEIEETNIPEENKNPEEIGEV